MTQTNPLQADAVRCEHGIRHPHPCDDCLARDIPTGRTLSEHPCYGLSLLAPTEFQHRNSWPLSSAEHPYCSRCGTEIEGPNNRQKDGAPLCWEPRPATQPIPLQGGNDTSRLDWLDQVNANTNERNGTRYGWKYDINHNRAALTDHNWPPLSIREAIDAAMNRSAK